MNCRRGFPDPLTTKGVSFSGTICQQRIAVLCGLTHSLPSSICELMLEWRARAKGHSCWKGNQQCLRTICTCFLLSLPKDVGWNRRRELATVLFVICAWERFVAKLATFTFGSAQRLTDFAHLLIAFRVHSQSYYGVVVHHESWSRLLDRKPCRERRK